LGNHGLSEGVYLNVRFLFVFRLAAIAAVAAVASGQASACQCSGSYYGKNNWELAKLETEGAAAIFEGTPVRFDLVWNVLTAKVGELIPSQIDSRGPADWPSMAVTFRVLRAYKGDLGPEVTIKTGLGGGDCGAVFAPGLTYLVFAGRSPAGVLGVSMCSPGGWIGSANAAVELRCLRKERPMAADLAPPIRWNAKEYAAHEEERKRDFDEGQKRYAAVTGEICGNVVGEGTSNGNAGIVSFLFSEGFSPYAHPTTSLNADGSFCSPRLGPGKYFLCFTKRSEQGPTTTAYYPGVSDREKATPIEVTAGQIRSAITFKIPAQKTYSVRGVLSIYDTSRTGAHTGYVQLVRLGAVPFPIVQSQRIDFKSSSAFPKIKYLNFENVPPGRYVAYVSGLGRGWYTKKQEVNVTDHMKFISLDLIHQK